MITAEQVRKFRDGHWELIFTDGSKAEFEFFISYHSAYMVKNDNVVVYQGFDLIKAVNIYNDLR